MIRYKIDVLDALKAHGYNTGYIRRNKLIGESYLTQIRRGIIVSTATLDKLCGLLECQPADLLEYVPDK